MSQVGDDHLSRVVLEDNLQRVDERIKANSPVFIVSPKSRSGTNFLANILKMHPVFQVPHLLWEDHVLENFHLLEEYVYRTSQRWAPEIRNSEDFRKRLLLNFGNGILSFLFEHIQEDRRLLCKTPESYNIEKFFLLFPEAKLLIVIRDGRDTVESAVRTWPNRIFAHERSTWRWAQGARRIINFMQVAGHDLRRKSWILVKYENLVEQPGATTSEIFAFLDIDPDTIDLTQVERLPLRGSSMHHGGRNKVHWDKVKKPRDFQPIGRWQSWGYWRKTIFKIIAGRELIRLGYVDNNHW